jgi:hypothetical protein
VVFAAGAGVAAGLDAAELDAELSELVVSVLGFVSDFFSAGAASLEDASLEDELLFGA